MQTCQLEDSNLIKSVRKEISSRKRDLLDADRYSEWRPCTKPFKFRLGLSPLRMCAPPGRFVSAFAAAVFQQAENSFSTHDECP